MTEYTLTTNVATHAVTCDLSQPKGAVVLTCRRYVKPSSASLDLAYWSYVSCPPYPWNAFRRLSNSLLKNQREYNKTNQKQGIKMKFKRIKQSEILGLLDDGEMVAQKVRDEIYIIYKLVRFPDGELKFFSMDYDDEEADSWGEVSEVCLSDLMEDEWYKANV
jgi:hypothetical protein